MRLIVCAQEIAMLADRHGFKYQAGGMARVLYRNWPDVYAYIKALAGVELEGVEKPASYSDEQRKASQKHRVRPTGNLVVDRWFRAAFSLLEDTKEQVLEVEHKDGRMPVLIARALAATNKDEYIEAEAEMAQELGETRRHLLETVTRHCNFLPGNGNERRIALQYTRETGIELDDRQPTLTWECRLPGEVDIKARLDAKCVDEEARMVEFKNRPEGLKNRLPDRDICQCQLYMQITGQEWCDVVDHAYNKIQIWEMKRNDMYFSQIILPRVKGRLKFLQMAVDNQEVDVLVDILRNAQQDLDDEKAMAMDASRRLGRDQRYQRYIHEFLPRMRSPDNELEPVARRWWANGGPV